MKGKDKCKILKEIRRQIAEQNDIAWVVSECSHKGECRGTCPKCESEVRQLERELSLRRKLGKTVAVAGVSAACMAGLTACSLDEVVEYGQELIEGVTDYITSKCDPQIEQLEGEVPMEIDYPDQLDGYVPYYDDYADYADEMT